MGLLEDAARLQEEKPGGGRSCQGCNLLRDGSPLSADMRNDLRTLFEDRNIAASTIEVVLKGRGVTMKHRNIQNHRRAHVQGWVG